MSTGNARPTTDSTTKARSLLLAGDVGGTKTLLGLFEPLPARPRPILIRAFSTLKYGDLGEMLEEFSRNAEMTVAPITSACFGVAGPVVQHTAALTNVPWTVEAHTVASSFGIPRVHLLNDLEALARAVPVLRSEELHTLQRGEAQAGGNMAVIAAGTGLGEAVLHRVGDRFVAMASEAGHADFAARTDAEIGLLKDLTHRFGRAQVEHVLSGQGLANIHRMTHDQVCSAIPDLDAVGAPARITASALDQVCSGCIAAVELFVDAYGAEAGNLGLRSLATAGMFVGGGIAPKILPVLTSGRFVRAFVSKAPFEALLRRMPIHVILDAQAGLLGAAVAAADGY